ncbi:putative ferulic acid Esterase/Feruloyl esterase, partial [Hortaea werneckii]
MHLSTLSLLSLLASTGLAFNCTREAFADILPSNASVSFTRSIPVDGNSTFVVPAGDIAYPTSPTGLQPLCAVQINVSSSDCSAYSFGLFLPNEWNERFLAVGNGGFAGGINWLDMGAGVGYGFAVMSTDTGHNSTPTDIEWALNSPQKKIDWGYRAMHGSVELSKHIVESYYNQAPKYNYYSGCSTGGRQGIREIQLYPDDFDGVLAGAPAWWTSHLQTWTVKIGLYNSPNASASHIPPSLFGVVGAEILKQCDPQDGLVDNIISDPEGCNVNLEAMLCG